MKTIYFNGTIVTINPRKQKVEAIVVEDNLIVDLGKYAKLIKKHGDDIIKYNLQGKTLLPGFIDAHSHASALVQSFIFVNLMNKPWGNISSIKDIANSLKLQLEKNPDKYDEENWLIGQGYDNTNFPNGEKLSKLDLDQVSQDIPIIVIHSSHHSVVVNSKILELLNINNNQDDLDENFYEKLPGTNELSGVLNERAFFGNRKILKQINGFADRNQWIELWKKVIDYYASQGYTTIQDESLSQNSLQFFDYLNKNNQLVLDVIANVITSDPKLMKYMERYWDVNENYRNQFRIEGIKLFFDGVIELQTAWLSKPYILHWGDKDNDYRGKMIGDNEQTYYWIKWAIANTLKVSAHCIGDQASQQYLDLYQKALKETKNRRDLRPIMIHSSLVRYDQLKRMKKIGMLPTFFAEDIYYSANKLAKDFIGKNRVENIAPAYWAKKLHLPFSFHHYSPDFSPNSMLTLHRIVNRKDQDNCEVGPWHQLSIKQALKSLTINSAYQYHEEKIRGSIAVNKVADFVILSQSPLMTSPENIKDIKILATIKNGKQIYTNQNWPNQQNV